MWSGTDDDCDVQDPAHTAAAVLQAAAQKMEAVARSAAAAMCTAAACYIPCALATTSNVFGTFISLCQQCHRNS
jgi:hypothetical protein